MDVLNAIGIAAPYYNLALVIVVVWLFIVLFRTKSRISLRPWAAFFVAVLIYIVEEVITVLRALGIVTIPVHINGFFELVIVSLIIYGLLVQKEILTQPGKRK